jgi:hypothetical protein
VANVSARALIMLAGMVEPFVQSGSRPQRARLCSGVPSGPERQDARLLGRGDVVARSEAEVSLDGLVTGAGELRLDALGVGIAATHARRGFTLLGRRAPVATRFLALFRSEFRRIRHSARDHFKHATSPCWNVTLIDDKL